jgi:DnaJ-class molecular chaperone
MNKLSLIVALLALLVLPPAAHSQKTEQAEAIQPDPPAAAAVRRPKMPNIITFESSLGSVHFPHRVHQKMGCKGCHHQIHAKDLVTPHEAYLTYSWVNCHDCHYEGSLTNGSYYGCAKCHHSNLENIADETLNAKVVVHKSCWKCHLSGTGVEASEKCSFCHVKEEKPLETSQEVASQ